MREIVKSIIIALFISMLFTGCVTVTSDYEQLKSDVNMLKKDLYDVRVTIKEIKEGLDLLSKTGVKGRTESLDAMRQAQLSLSNTVQAINTELVALRARFEEQKHFTERIIEDMKKENQKMDARMEGIDIMVKNIQQKLDLLELKIKMIEERSEKTLPSTPPPADTLQKPVQEETQPQQVDDIKKYYLEAFDLYQKKKYDEARKRFEEIIKRFPDEKLAGNAQFWIAESYYAEKNYEDAILNYETLIKKYPNSEKVPTAYLKEAYSFIAIGDEKTGKVLLERVISKYPDTQEAKAARKKLDKLKRSQKKQ